MDAQRAPGDVWLQRVGDELHVGFFVGTTNVLTPTTARDLAVEIMRTLVRPVESAELAEGLLKAADDAEALAGIDVN